MLPAALVHVSHINVNLADDALNLFRHWISGG
jgi:hypothetical protein